MNRIKNWLKTKRIYLFGGILILVVMTSFGLSSSSAVYHRHSPMLKSNGIPPSVISYTLDRIYGVRFWRDLAMEAESLVEETMTETVINEGKMVEESLENLRHALVFNDTAEVERLAQLTARLVEGNDTKFMPVGLKVQVERPASDYSEVMESIEKLRLSNFSEWLTKLPDLMAKATGSLQAEVHYYNVSNLEIEAEKLNSAIAEGNWSEARTIVDEVEKQKMVRRISMPSGLLHAKLLLDRARHHESLDQAGTAQGLATLALGCLALEKQSGHFASRAEYGALASSMLRYRNALRTGALTSIPSSLSTRLMGESIQQAIRRQMEKAGLN